MRRLFAALDARWEPVVSWRGGDLDRLMDEQHARLGSEVVRRLRAVGWEVGVEITYSDYGDRGSIDIVGARRADAAVLIVELKSDLTAIESTMRKLDEKARVGPRVVAPARFGFRPAIVGRLLVLPATTAARIRVARMADLLDSALPARGVAIRRWLRRPVGDLGGILFVPDTNGGSAMHRTPVRKRVRHAGSSTTSGPTTGGTGQIGA